VFSGLYRHRRAVPLKKIISTTLIIVLTVLIISTSWYIIKEIQIDSGLDRSEVKMVQRANRQDNHLKRLSNGINRVLAHRPAKLKPIAYAIAILIILGLFHRRSRWVVITIVVPFSLMWGLFFSYDSRNLALAVPFMAFSASYGAYSLKKRFTGLTTSKPFPSFRIYPLPLLIALLAVLVILSFTELKKENLIRHQNQQRMELGEADLNQRLYQFHKKEGIKGKIVTNYLYLSVLPELKQFFIPRNGRITSAFLDYLESIEGKDIRYLLMPVVNKSEKETYRRIHEKLKTGRYRLIFKLRGYRFMDIRARRGENE
ncbi:MAG: hypothetical protein GY940_24905, partial [bacterium]|nr:hypothetical protein [bacterium]